MVGTPMEFDAALDLCRHKHRRIVLGALAEQQQSLTTNDLARTIIEHNNHTPLSEVAGETVTRIETGLHHVHLPKLANSGLVEHDAERNRVEPSAEFARVEPHLSTILDADPLLATPLEM